jgi:hypothetical protein
LVISVRGANNALMIYLDEVMSGSELLWGNVTGSNVWGSKDIWAPWRQSSTTRYYQMLHRSIPDNLHAQKPRMRTPLRAEKIWSHAEWDLGERVPGLRAGCPSAPMGSMIV